MTCERPLISVLMGVYNTHSRDILAAAIGSILAQSYTNIELIICDDGSTDNTRELLAEFVATDARIRVIANDRNRALSYTLNHCLSVAQGEFIARMDSDDIAAPHRLERELAFLQANPKYAFVGSNVNLFAGDTIWGRRVLPAEVTPKDFLFNSPFVHPTIMIRRAAIEEAGGYAEDAVRCEDYDLWMRLYAMGYLGYNLQEFLLNFREDSAAYSRRAYRYRIYEARIRYRGFRALGLLPLALPYVLKPLIVGLLPQRFLALLRREGNSSR